MFGISELGLPLQQVGESPYTLRHICSMYSTGPLLVGNSEVTCTCTHTRGYTYMAILQQVLSMPCIYVHVATRLYIYLQFRNVIFMYMRLHLHPGMKGQIMIVTLSKHATTHVNRMSAI